MPMSAIALKKILVGKTVPRPTGGTLSGHAAGEPFEKLVLKTLKKQVTSATKHFQYLNDLYASHPNAKTAAERHALISSKPLSYLLRRGTKATANWSVSKPFVEKQNDTADIIHSESARLILTDVKTRNRSQAAQPPNIISARKLAETCKLMIDEGDFNSFDVAYIEVDWALTGSLLKCTGIHRAELFKCPPAKLYINWAAATQIQFHVDSLDQSFAGTREEWCRQYLRAFVSAAGKRVKMMEKKLIERFSSY